MRLEMSHLFKLSTQNKREKSENNIFTSMYLDPMWCLCLLSAMSLCSCETNLINASPFRRPCGDKHKATPPLQCLRK